MYVEGSVQSALKSTANSAQQPLEHAEHRAVPPTLSSPIEAVSILEMPLHPTRPYEDVGFRRRHGVVNIQQERSRVVERGRDARRGQGGQGEGAQGVQRNQVSEIRSYHSRAALLRRSKAHLRLVV